jgi:hypothetical protein
MKQCVPLLQKLVESGKPFGEQPPVATSPPSLPFTNGTSANVFAPRI